MTTRDYRAYGRVLLCGHELLRHERGELQRHLGVFVLLRDCRARRHGHELVLHERGELPRDYAASNYICATKIYYRNGGAEYIATTGFFYYIAVHVCAATN